MGRTHPESLGGGAVLKEAASLLLSVVGKLVSVMNTVSEICEGAGG